MDSRRAKLAVFLFYAFIFSSVKTQTTPPPPPPPCNVSVEVENTFVICENGTVIRLKMTETVPPSLDHATNVQSKDVVYSSQINESARIFLPVESTKNKSKKLPLIVYYHGGGFSYSTFANPAYHDMTLAFSAGSNATVVSFNYRLAPEHLLPTAFNDSWTAMQWIASHVSGNGPEEWLNLYADFDRVFLMGDSAGATIAVNMALRHGQQKLEGINIRGMLLQMPYFINLATIPTGHRFYSLLKNIYPTAMGTDNLLLNPIDDPNLSMIGVLNAAFVFGQNDSLLIDNQRQFVQKLKTSSWKGKTEVIEIEGATHMFNLIPANPELAAKAKKLMDDMNRIIVSWAV